MEDGDDILDVGQDAKEQAIWEAGHAYSPNIPPHDGKLQRMGLDTANLNVDLIQEALSKT